MKGAILVVDDERSICIAIERLLCGRGYEVESAHSGEAAVAALERRLAHLVITDLSLTGMSGMDLLRQIKQETPDTAVIMITAYGSERLAVEAMKLGAADYLRKPFDNDELELIGVRLFWNEHRVAVAHVTMWRWVSRALRPRSGVLTAGTWPLAYRAT